MKRPSVLYVVSEPWYFANHRLDHARALLAAGFDVHVATRTGDRFDELVDAGCALHELDLARGATTLSMWWREIRALRRIVRAARPDVVHAVALKADALAITLLAGFRRPAVILGVNGLGISAVTESKGLAVFRHVLRLVARLPRVELLFQTTADQRRVMGKRAGGVVIPGVGVDLERFWPAPAIAIPPLRVVYLGRAVRSKGLPDLAAAARDPRLAELGIEIHAYCALDDNSPGALGADELAAMDAAPAMHVHPPTGDPAGVLRAAHAAILPSRGGEGVSKFVLEALASGVPILVSDDSGSAEVITHGLTGFTLAAGEPESIADTLVTFAELAPEKRSTMAAACRSAAERNYGLGVILPAIVGLHQRLAGVTP